MPDFSVLKKLSPGSDFHTKVIGKLKDRLNFSERAMSSFYPRWDANEMRAQAYLHLPSYEKMLREAADSGKPPDVVNIVVPYGFAAQQTIATYLLHTFAGRDPMYQIGSYSKYNLTAAMEMEKVLEYNSMHTRMVRHLWQLSLDTMTYGAGIFAVDFKKEKAMRSRWRAQAMTGMDSILGIQGTNSVREMQTVYQGNDVCCVDPYNFFPDPRCPMSQVSKKGEFVFIRSFSTKVDLLTRMGRGEILWADKIERNERIDNYGTSKRNILARGTQPLQYDTHLREPLDPPVQVDYGVVKLIPKDWELSDSETPEIWLFEMGNKSQIIRAELFDADHARLPVAITEPYALGYGFGNAGLFDYMAPLQDLMSWLVNSHMFNVREAIANQFIVDPNMVEMQDLKRTTPGRIIRLKRAALGQDVRAAIQQLQVQDVTRGNMSDLQIIMRLADILTGATDNLKGLQDAGGRKTATEIRQSNDAGASRLAALARVISAQCLTDSTEMMVLNVQQYMDYEFYTMLLGEDEFSALIRPDLPVGDFYYPIHDGSLPMDKTALFDIWQQLFAQVLADPQLRSTYDVTRIFEFVGKLGGAETLDQYKLMAQPGGGLPVPQLATQDPGAIAAQQQAGNVISLPQASGAVNGLPAAGRRAAGAIA